MPTFASWSVVQLTTMEQANSTSVKYQHIKSIVPVCHKNSQLNSVNTEMLCLYIYKQACLEECIKQSCDKHNLCLQNAQTTTSTHTSKRVGLKTKRVVIKGRCFISSVPSHLTNITCVCKNSVATKLDLLPQIVLLLLNGVEQCRGLPSVALRSFWANMSRLPNTDPWIRADHASHCWLAALAAIFALHTVVVPAIFTGQSAVKFSAVFVCSGVRFAVFQYCVRR
jgi:hypothetical protein